MRVRTAAASLLLALAVTSSGNADGGGRANDVALANGRIWTTARGALVRIDPGTNRVVGSRIYAGVGFQGARIASGEGAVWALDVRALAMIDPSAGRPSAGRLRRTIRLRHKTYALAAGYGAVWLPSFTDDTLASVDARSGRRRTEIRVAHSPQAVAAGAGSVWVGSIGRWHKGPGGVITLDGPGIVSEIDPVTGSTRARITTCRGPEALAVKRGSVWVVCGRGVGADERLDRIDVRAKRVVDSFRVPHAAAALAVDARFVWVVSSPRGAGGVLTRIELATGQSRTRSIPHSWYPAAVAAAGGHVWVADPGVAGVIRLSAETMRVTGRVVLGQ